MPVLSGITGSSLIEKIKEHIKAPLFRNAYYLMGSHVLTSPLSFVFWVVAARFYTTEEVGLAGAIIPMISFIAGMADLGIGFGIIRFLPNAGDRANTLMNTSFTIQLIASLLVSIIFLAGLSLWSPAMLILQSSPIYLIGFVLLTIMSTFIASMRSIFIASSASRLVLMADLITRGTAIPCLFVLASFSGFFGVLGSQGLAVFITIILALVVFLPGLRAGYFPKPNIDRNVVKEIIPYSLGNYIGQLVGSIQFWLLPTIVLNLLGAELNAYFYVAMAISSVVVMVPSSLSTSAFAESSHFEDRLSSNIRNAFILSLVLDVVVVAAIFGLGKYILLLFGREYSAGGTMVLKLFALSVFPQTISWFLLTSARVKKQIKFLIGVQAALAIIVISLIYIMGPMWGLKGVGIAYLLGNVIVASGALCWFLLIIRKRKKERPDVNLS